MWHLLHMATYSLAGLYLFFMDIYSDVKVMLGKKLARPAARMRLDFSQEVAPITSEKAGEPRPHQ